MSSRLALAAALAFVTGAAYFVAPSSKPDPLAEPEFTISGPYSYENLSVFLMHGHEAGPARNILTLQEALEQNLVVVHETGSVNELAVENKSADAEVFMQSGDIVKGGRQDRLIAHDLLLPAKSGVVPVDSFCVEQSRWSGRPGEAASHFAVSATQAPKALKLAANDSKQQSEVWAKVAETQSKLSHNVGKTVNAPASPTSLQLALEDKDLAKKLAGYEQALANLLTDRHDVVGFAFAVNGKVEGAEIYGSPALFRKLWPKLLKSAATDALAEAKKGAKVELASATATDVRGFLQESAQGRRTEPAARNNRDAEPRLTRSAIQAAEARLTSIGMFEAVAPQRENLIMGLGVNSDGGMTGNVNINTLGLRPLPAGGVAGIAWNGQEGLRQARAHSFRDQVIARRGFVDFDGSVAHEIGLGNGQGGRTSQPTPQPPAQPDRLRVSQTSNERGVMVESRDRARGGAIIHRSYIAK